MHDQKSFIVDESVSLSVYVFLNSVLTSRLPNYLDRCLFELIIAVVTHLTRLPGKLVRWVATDHAMHFQSPVDYHHYYRDRHVVVRCAPFFFKQMSGSFRFGSAAVVTKLAANLIVLAIEHQSSLQFRWRAFATNFSSSRRELEINGGLSLQPQATSLLTARSSRDGAKSVLAASSDASVPLGAAGATNGPVSLRN
jgi:hypothetical protein